MNKSKIKAIGSLLGSERRWVTYGFEIEICSVCSWGYNAVECRHKMAIIITYWTMTALGDKDRPIIDLLL